MPRATLADARRRRAIRASATPRASTGSIRSGRPMKRTALDPFILAVSRSIDPVERGARAPISAADRIASPRGAVSRVRPRGCAGGDADRGFRQGSDLARARRSNAHSAATRARLAGSRRERARGGTRSRRRRWVPARTRVDPRDASFARGAFLTAGGIHSRNTSSADARVARNRLPRDAPRRGARARPARDGAVPDAPRSRARETRENARLRGS